MHANSCGADPHGPAGRAFQFTALHMAVMSQRVDIAKYLLAEGADINAKFEPHGDSSFELAERSTSKGGQEVYQLLKVVYEKQLEKKRAELQKAQAAK